MKHSHQLVKVTNFIFCLTLVWLQDVPLVGRGSAEVAGKATTGTEYLPSISSEGAIGSTGGNYAIAEPYKSSPPHCTRAVFSSARIRNGSIAPSHSKHSGLFPSAICYQYEFIGEGAERIQIIFSEFRLPSKLEPNECGETDILMVLFQLDGRDEVVETLCGDTLPKPILSNGPRLLLEFRSSFNNTENKGFTADFFFLTNFGISAGHQPNQSECTFHFFKNASNQGWIQSPNFPGAYPRNIRCNYFFYGDPLDYVLIRFTYFDIEGIAPCDENSASDFVEFSNFITRDRKFALYCGLRRDLIVRSDGKFFRVTMVSNDRLDGTGFRALYAFESSITAVMMGSAAPGGDAGRSGRVVGPAAGVPYPSQQHHLLTKAARNVATTLAKIGILGAASHSSGVLLMLASVLIASVQGASQLVTTIPCRHHPFLPLLIQLLLPVVVAVVGITPTILIG
ncbi:cubilin [Toxorhynchites rutilus septentrionalis]|uniref:cubilin n=1 Tax=Toxorhynchites rutilus septentrionalis TaxID=329112 RepID=UPI002478A74F|nr:cubilin [Toxorhynchites rutilus septentrionalis]